jgi:DNA ligase-1
VNTFEAVSKVSGRLDKESLFTKFFISVILTTPEDLETVVYLSSNEVAPAYDGLELGIGDSLLVKAICEATGRNKVHYIAHLLTFSLASNSLIHSGQRG